MPRSVLTYQSTIVHIHKIKISSRIRVPLRSARRPTWSQTHTHTLTHIKFIDATTNASNYTSSNARRFFLFFLFLLSTFCCVMRHYSALLFAGESVADTSTSSPDLPGPISPSTTKMENSRISPTPGLLSQSSDNR